MSPNPIYPLAYELIPGQTCRLYDVSFPQRWKEELINIVRLNNPKVNFQYKLPTVPLEKLVNSWMEGIVSLKPLSVASDDRQWLSSCMAFTDKRLKHLYEIIRVWVTGTYINEGRSPVVRDSAKRFCDTMRVSEFYGLTSERIVTLSNADGTVNGDAFDTLPLLAVNHLQGKELELNGHTIHLCYAARNELVSLPIEDPKTRQSFSYVFHFSVQTTPPGRFALLLCDMSVRRWVRDLKKSVTRSDNGPDVHSGNEIHAHIYLKQSDKYCQIPIQFPFEKGQAKEPRWTWQDKECYNLYGYDAIPNMQNLWEAVEQGSKIYLLPYKTGMWSFQQPEIGTGVSATEKDCFYHEMLNLLDGMVKESGAARPFEKRIEYQIPRYKDPWGNQDPQEYAAPEKFREWVSRCAETDRLTFELCGMSESPEQAAVLDALREQIKKDFGENTPESCLHVDIASRESGDMASALREQTSQEKLNRSDSIQRELAPAKGVTACLFVLPGKNAFQDYDPKDSIRHGFALTGRVTQFVQPKSKEEEEITFKSRIKNAVYDLYRQIGVTTFVNTDQLAKKAHKLLADVPCVGMHIFTQVHGIQQNKGRFLPVFVETDLLNGKTRVSCSAFEHSPVNYREACLEMARLFEKRDLEKRCKDASFAPAKEKLMRLAHQFSSPDRPVILLVRSNGNTRPLWRGISDKAVSQYAYTDESPYIPQKIDVGMKDSPYLYPLLNRGVRILRVRDNEEVPDYYTPFDQAKNAYPTVSGVLRYQDTFWSIGPKPPDKRYNASRKQTRFKHPKSDFAESRLIELYPLQLQPGDDPWQYIRYVHALRFLPVQSQYDQAVNLPLPLHLAEQLQEYLFEG